MEICVRAVRNRIEFGYLILRDNDLERIIVGDLTVKAQRM